LRAASSRSLGLALIATLFATAGVSAHRVDEYLQAARVAVEPGRVEIQLDLTPGIAVADALVAEIDGDHDGLLSADEKLAYVARVFRAVELQLDGRTLHPEPVATTFPDVEALRRGQGTIQLRSAATFPRVSNGDHQLLFRNTHRSEVGAYLANALVPTDDRVAITRQTRHPEQTDLTLDYVVVRPAATEAWLLTIIAGAVLLVTRRRRMGHRTSDVQRTSEVQ
jgi:hypothetical protein